MVRVPSTDFMNRGSGREFPMQSQKMANPSFFNSRTSFKEPVEEQPNYEASDYLNKKILDRCKTITKNL